MACNFPGCISYSNKNCDNCHSDYCSEHVVQGDGITICTICLMQQLSTLKRKGRRQKHRKD